MDNIKVEQLVE
jgi:hypothetical protein